MLDLSGAEPPRDDAVARVADILVLRAAQRLDLHPANTARAPEAGPAGPVFNEQGLHSLIRQIVREELQQSLGESLTQRIRRVVRTEVVRLISGQASA